MPALKLIFIAAFLSFGSKQVLSQDYPFIKYTPKDGLISNRVQNFYQDTKGRIYFMTANGLSVYDGARFINYGVEDGLANPNVNDILELSPDSLLIATNTGELNALVRGSIKTLHTRNGFCPVINKFYRDKDEMIYVASDQGLYRFDKDIFTPIPFDDSSGNAVKSVYDIQELGHYFLLQRPHLSPKFSDVLLIHKKTLRSQPFLLKGHVSCVLRVKAEQLLLVIANQKILSFDLNAAEMGIMRHKELPRRFQFLKQLIPEKVTIDRYQNIWCVTSNSVVRVKQDGTIQAFNNTNGLDVNNIRSIIVDKENVLWLLTDGSGVLKLVNRNLEMQSSDINAIYEHVSGKTWMLRSSGKILECAYGNQTQKWHLNSTPRLMGLAMRKKILLLFSDSSIYEAQLTKQTNRLSLKKIYSNNIEPINYSRAEIDEDYIYIPGKVLTVIKSSNEVTRIPLPFYVDQVSFDGHGQLWAVSRAGHLLCFTINHRDTQNPLNLIFANKIAISQPRSLVVDKTGKIWIGTRYSGIYCLEYKNGKITLTGHWSTADGLTDNFIYHLNCDNNNVIWAGTQGGLDKIGGSGKIVESVTRNNHIYQVIHKIIMGKDKVWALGIGSIIRFTNEATAPNEYQPRVQIIRVMSGDKSLGLLPEHTILPAHTRELTIQVAAPSFIDEKRVRFSYLLDGNEKSQWSTPSADANFRFINLLPAKYTLRIKAIFPVAEYETQELSYDFTILPPWWQTWWFRSLLILFFLTAVALAIKAYYQNKLQRQKIIFEKQQAIQQERTRIAMEMHDDLGSGLTVIRYLAGGLSTNPLSLIKENALKIETSAKQLVDNMNDIIWTIKSDNNSLPDILGYIRKQVAEMLDNVGIDYQFDFPKHPADIIMKNEQKRNLLLISKEAVHNVIKHSGATRVTIIVSQNEKYLQLSFSDNGKGFSNNATNYFGNGLKNIQQRVKQIGGNIEIINNEGTTVSVKMMLS